MSRDHQPTRQEILNLIKHNGEMTVKELSADIGITTMGVRQHLATLEREGLVQCRMQRQKIGRPFQIFSLTDAADKQFPSTYGEFALSLLDQIAAMDGTEKVDALLKRRQQQLKSVYNEKLKGLKGRKRMEALAKARDQDGYMCELTVLPDGKSCLVEHHCPIAAVAKNYPQICALEQELFEETLDMHLVREEHLATGGKCCSYHESS